jgi:16S rRNA (uracil1498-N3)-methyltransferase
MMNNLAVMLPRFFVPDLDPSAGAAALPAEEARHLTRVLRLGAGDEIAVFDGRGHERRARVTTAVRDRVQVELLDAIAPAPEPPVPITLVQAVLKGDSMDAVVRDATMMGAASIEPIVTARTIGRRQAIESGRASDRWTRIAVSSAKQCGRATLPLIGSERPLSDWLAHGGAGLKLILVEPSAASGAESSLRLLETRAPAALSLLVGPEGGWAPEERHLAEAAGCLPVTLGGLTLRAEAVPLAALAIVRFVLER